MKPNGTVGLDLAVRKPWICSSCRQRSFQRTQHSLATAAKRVSIKRLTKINTVPSPERTIDGASKRLFSTTTSRCREWNLPEDGRPARTRFAPSPTGYLHIGGLRTALFCFLLAKRTKGQFILRIENTDQKRLVPDAEERIYQDLQWAGIVWDEGPIVGGKYGPYRQSERMAIYQDHARQLLDNGTAYRCFCTPQAFAGTRAEFVSSGCYQNCSSLSHDESMERAKDRKQRFTVRFRQPADALTRKYPELVYRQIQRPKRSPLASLGASEDDASLSAADTILMKSDGTPTYHFASVVDDHLMEITHVIRGEEWLVSTPLHYDLYSAFQWQPPKYAHVGLLVDRNKAKLSKRSGNTVLEVRSMRDQQGIFPETLVNFLVLLGWSNPTQNDVMGLRELSREFDLKFTRGSAMVQTEKLWYMQKQYFARWVRQAEEGNCIDPIRNILERFVAEVRRRYPDFVPAVVHDPGPLSTDVPESLTAYCTEILLADNQSFLNIGQYTERNSYFFSRPTVTTTSSSSRIRSIIESLLLYSKFSEPDDTSLPSATTPTTARPIIAVERRIHSAIVRSTWAAVIQSRLPVNDEVMLKELPSDVATAARMLAAKPGQAEELALSYKDVNKVLMGFMRDRLSGGRPGPGISATMAVLGHAECYRRLLGVQGGPGAGWDALNKE